MLVDPGAAEDGAAVGLFNLRFRFCGVDFRRGATPVRRALEVGCAPVLLVGVPAKRTTSLAALDGVSATI
ncbi:hypothetical protein GCM10025857_21680 [Alicyclobacillus contaminans]|nr:hypothetical protein GCM10025857_21680 [Alicyclobacillus contaminans]